jgi:hypothetical protein
MLCPFFLNSLQTRAVNEERVNVFVAQSVGFQRRPNFRRRRREVHPVDEAEDLRGLDGKLKIFRCIKKSGNDHFCKKLKEV